MTRFYPRLVVAGALLLLAQFAPQLAHAQYSWLDDKGTRVFSDRPPPPGTPAGRILKAPHRSEADSAAPAAPPPGPTEAPKQPSLAEREADYRKRQAQRQADEKKAQDEAAHKATQQEMCADARQQE